MLGPIPGGAIQKNQLQATHPSQGLRAGAPLKGFPPCLETDSQRAYQNMKLSELPNERDNLVLVGTDHTRLRVKLTSC